MKPNDSEVLARIEAQIAALDKKVDALISSSQKPMERSSFSNKGFGDKGKMTYKAVCAECGQTCGVPFKPVGGRPVFCSECFAKQQEEGSGESRFHKKPRDFRQPAGGKKSFFKKR
jgi:CxxC-x17-CxxC domain-containing protein